MINFPFVSLPEHFTKLLVSNIQNSTQGNNNLEMYIYENKELNALVKAIFRDIDPDGFLGKIISISGWIGIRNRLAAVYIEYAMAGRFPEVANLSLVTDIINIENRLRHFTPSGFSRAFLLGFYAKFALINVIHSTEGKNHLIIKEEHFEFMKFSKTKSIRIDWLMFQLIQFDHFLGTDRLNSLLKANPRYDSLYALLSPEEKNAMIENCMAYGASINDSEIYLNDASIQL
jgi:hypothetical protein